MCERPSARGRLGALAVALVVALTVAGFHTANGLAADRPKAPEGSAVLQYVETVPTSAGPTAGASGSSPSPSDSPSQALRKALATIVSSPRYGAPQKAGRRGTDVRTRSSSDIPAPSVSRAFDAAVDTFGPWSGARQVGVFVVLFVTTAGAIVIAARRRRV